MSDPDAMGCDPLDWDDRIKLRQHLRDCKKCLDALLDHHIELQTENAKLRTIPIERSTSEHHFEHNRLMSPEFAAIKAEVLSRTGCMAWHQEVNYHNELVFLAGDPADIFGLCYLNLHPAPTYTQVELRTRTHYAEFQIPCDQPRSIHGILDDLADSQSKLWKERKQVSFAE